MQFRQPQQGQEGDLPFDARQGRPQAVVDAVAEGDVAVVGAEDVEAVGFGELLRVPVGGSLHGPDALSRPKPFASQFKVGYHHPGNALDGAVVAQAFPGFQVERSRRRGSTSA